LNQKVVIREPARRPVASSAEQATIENAGRRVAAQVSSEARIAPRDAMK
jgi:hypothetical protein